MPDSPFTQFYRQHVGFVYRSVHLLGVGGAQVDDVVQEVFLIAHRRAGSLRADASVRGWLFSITRNFVNRVRRGHARAHRRRAALSLAIDAAGSDRTVDPMEALLTLRGLLEELTESQRIVFVGIEILGMSAPQLAEALGMKLNTVYSRLRLARARFEGLAGDHGELVDRATADADPTAKTKAAIWAGLAPKLGGSSLVTFAMQLGKVGALCVCSLGATVLPPAGAGPAVDTRAEMSVGAIAREAAVVPRAVASTAPRDAAIWPSPADTMLAPAEPPTTDVVGPATPRSTARPPATKQTAPIPTSEPSVRNDADPPPPSPLSLAPDPRKVDGLPPPPPRLGADQRRDPPAWLQPHRPGAQPRPAPPSSSTVDRTTFDKLRLPRFQLNADPNGRPGGFAIGTR